VKIIFSQAVIDFKIKVEPNNYIGYENLDLKQFVCKGDSIFGVDKNNGCVYSFNKGVTFNKLDYTQKDNIDFSDHISEENVESKWYYAKSLDIENKLVFLKDGNVIIYNERSGLFYESKDWISFSVINTEKFYPSSLNITDNVCYFISDSLIYKSLDLRTWEKIPLPSFSSYAFGIQYYKDELYLFCQNDKYENFIKNGVFKNAVYKFHDNNWEKITDLNFNSYQDQSFKPLHNVHFFNNKIYYNNYGKSFVFNLKTNKYDDFGTAKVLTSCVYNDSLFFTTNENNKIMTFFDVIHESNIELSKAPFFACEINSEYLIIDGKSTILRTKNDFTLKKELEQRNDESKYWVEKTVKNIDSEAIDRTLGKIVYHNQHPVIEKLIPLTRTANGREISYSPYFKKSSFESKRYIVSSTINSSTTFEQLKLVNEKSINIFNNESITYRVKDFDVYRGDSPYYDEYNRDCDFNLKTVGTDLETTSLGNKIIFFKANYNELENCIDKHVYHLMESFEYEINGNIETFKVKSYQGGNEVFAFIAETAYNKNVYLFTYDMINSKLQVNNLSKIYIKDYYKFNIKDCTISKVYRTIDKNIHVFLQFIDKLVPLTIKINSNPIFVENSVMNAGVVDDFKFGGWSGCIVPIYSDTSKTIIAYANYYSDNSDIAKLNSTIKVYDLNFNLIFEKTIVGLKITCIYKQKNHLIIGGFSVDKGYIGFPNPRVMVFNMSSKFVTYDKVLLQKNCKVDNITSDNNGNIEITTAIWSKNWNHSKNLFLDCYVIFDKLEENGKFKNNLFE